MATGGSVATALGRQVNLIVAKMTHADLLRHLNVTELPVRPPQAVVSLLVHSFTHLSLSLSLGWTS
jgi:hypothetical protein